MEEKKGLSPLTWVAIGCAVIILVSGIVFTFTGFFLAKKVGKFANELLEDPASAAEILLRDNPDLEIVQSDRAAGKLTIRDKTDGRTLTVDYEDIEKGILNIASGEAGIAVDLSPDGTGHLFSVRQQGQEKLAIGRGGPEDVPEWVPIYPDAENEGLFSTVMEGSSRGSFVLHSTDPVEDVLTFYEQELGEAGFETERTSAAGGETGGGNLVGTRDGRTLTLIAKSVEAGSESTVEFSEEEGVSEPELETTE